MSVILQLFGKHVPNLMFYIIKIYIVKKINLEINKVITVFGAIPKGGIGFDITQYLYSFNFIHSAYSPNHNVDPFKIRFLNISNIFSTKLLNS